MPIYQTFAKRKRDAANSGKPEIYSYDCLPMELKVQVIHLWKDVFDAFPQYYRPVVVKGYWKWVHDTLAREMGVFNLVTNPSISGDRLEDCSNFLLGCDNVDHALSLIELSFRYVDVVVRQGIAKDFRFKGVVKLDIDELIQELNQRFCEHSIGYQYAAGQIIEVNSQYLHSETVEPAITLLHDAGFEGAMQEFMAAHKCYRERNYKDAIVNASNAFESTMRTICDNRGWAYRQNATSSKLIEILFSYNLIPTEMTSHFTRAC